LSGAAGVDELFLQADPSILKGLRSFGASAPRILALTLLWQRAHIGAGAPAGQTRTIEFVLRAGLVNA
jgi:hypothetical protein